MVKDLIQYLFKNIVGLIQFDISVCYINTECDKQMLFCQHQGFQFGLHFYFKNPNLCQELNIVFLAFFNDGNFGIT